MKNLMVALTAIAAAGPGIAVAGGGSSCAEAVELYSDQVVSGDTSDNANTIGAFGPLSSTGPDAIYFFVAPNVPIAPLTAELTSGFPGGGGLYLTQTCGGNAGAPIHADAGAAGDTTLTIDLTDAGGGQLVPGTTYYVVVSNSPADNLGGSGTYNMTTGLTPVALRIFSID
jgi:hypothetical protein